MGDKLGPETTKNRCGLPDESLVGEAFGYLIGGRSVESRKTEFELDRYGFTVAANRLDRTEVGSEHPS